MTRVVLAAALLGATAQGLLRRRVPGGRQRWSRRNHAGAEVTLTEGLVVVTGATTALLTRDPVAGLVTLLAGATGAWDDLHPDADRKGLRGHLGALVRGEVSGGALKIVVLAGAGVMAALPGARSRPVTDTLVRASLVAGSANMVNLLDLRPGRALKAVLLLGLPLSRAVGGTPAAAAVGASLVALPGDLRGESMLGDTGANALGALLGVSLSRAGRPGDRALVLLGLTAATLVSERVSFTRVIEATPGLRELDAWGRPPR